VGCSQGTATIDISQIVLIKLDPTNQTGAKQGSAKEHCSLWGRAFLGTSRPGRRKAHRGRLRHGRPRLGIEIPDTGKFDHLSFYQTCRVRHAGGPAVADKRKAARDAGGKLQSLLRRGVVLWLLSLPGPQVGGKPCAGPDAYAQRDICGFCRLEVVRWESV